MYVIALVNKVFLVIVSHLWFLSFMIECFSRCLLLCLTNGVFEIYCVYVSISNPVVILSTLLLSK